MTLKRNLLGKRAVCDRLNPFSMDGGLLLDSVLKPFFNNGVRRCL